MWVSLSREKNFITTSLESSNYQDSTARKENGNFLNGKLAKSGEFLIRILMEGNELVVVGWKKVLMSKISKYMAFFVALLIYQESDARNETKEFSVE